MSPLSTHAGFRTWIAVALSVLMLGALLLRLHAVSQRIPEAPDELALHLVGDESGYEGLAYALLQGVFFQSPVRVPVYPMFIAGVYSALGERSMSKLLYVQAFIGVAAIPVAGTLQILLHDWLAHRRMEREEGGPAAVAAEAVAPHPDA